MKLAVAVVAFLSCAVTANAMASDDALTRCRAITENAARLTCYDAIVIAPPQSSSSSAASAGKASPAQPTPEQFGLQPKANPNEINSIESTFAGKFEGWGPNSRITLANGQVWQVADDSSAFCNCDNKKVLIRRGALGTFFLEIEGTNRSPRVKRLK
jgi:hypothetical protein